MSLTKAQVREFLSAAGCEADKIAETTDKIIDGHLASIDVLREERDNLKEQAAKNAELEKELKDLQSKNEKDPYKVKYEGIKEEFAKYKEEIKTKEENAKKSEAYSKLLKEAGISEKRINAILKASEDSVKSIEFDDEGKVTNANDLKKAIIAEWDDFIVKTEVKGAKTDKPPANGGKKTMTKEEIMAIKDGTERRKAMYENKELFGIGDD